MTCQRRINLSLLLCIFYQTLLQCFILSAQNVNEEPRTFGYFNGSTYLVLNQVFEVYNSPIGLSFKTCQETGTVLSQTAENGNSVMLRIKKGQFVAEFYSAGDQTPTTLSIDRYFNDNRWINIDLYLQPASDLRQQIGLSLAGEEVVLANRNIRLEIFDIHFANSTKLYIGNTPDGDDGFIGCIMAGPRLDFNASFDAESYVAWNVCPLNNMITCDTEGSCSSNPCKNGGSCSESNATYTCTCSLRYSGSHCEIDIGSLCNSSSTTCVQGSCVEVAMGNRTICECASSYHGSSCDLPGPNPCSGSPCLNEGACESNDSKNYTCWCRPGFEGSLCETNINECLSQPCLNHAECKDLINDFECVCNVTGYTGRRCENDVDECESNPCPMNATCFNRPGDFVCLCPNGFEGEFCNVTIPYCQSAPCQNGGTCFENQATKYVCECPEGFTGSRCETTFDHCYNHDCNPYNQECISKLNTYICICKDGFGELNCTNIDECASNPCRNNATCVDEINAFKCQCLLGYTGTLCEIDINECENNPCQNGADCHDEIGRYSCECRRGWTGRNCSQVFQPCNSGPCKNNASCTTLLDSQPPGYMCGCARGFDGYHCEVDVDDCYQIECGYNMRCIDGIDTYQCACNSGYVEDEVSNCTVEINECEPNPCENNATCSDLIARYSCNCVRGYEGKNCENEVDYCLSNPCKHGGRCEKRFGSYDCFCATGYVGSHCEFLYDACTSNPCAHGGRCVLKDDRIYECVCSLGYNGTNCGEDINECASNPCMNDGVCADLIGEYNCSCAPGWKGERCEENIDECESNPCQNGASCIDKIASYDCDCQPGYAGDSCEMDIDECASSPCQHSGLCINEIAKFNCLCNGTGFTGERCDDEVDECVLYDPCKSKGVCVDRINDYVCNCLSGYTGRDCEEDINECQSQPCVNGGTCLERSDESLYPSYFQTNFTYQEAAGYACSCAPGYEGVLCEEQINECERWEPCRNNAICLDLINDYLCQCVGNVGGRNCSVALTGCNNGHRCLNDAICIPHLEDEGQDLHNYTCLCKPGFTGVYCDRTTTASFIDSSLAVFRARSRDQSVRKFSFDFRTTLLDADVVVVKFQDINETAKIGLRDGQFRVSMTNTTSTTSDRISLNNGVWHHVIVRFTAYNVTLYVNEVVNQTEAVIPTSTEQDFDISEVIFGFHNDTTTIPYSGCVRDVMISDEIFALEDADILNDVEEECVKSEVCASGTCSGRGECIDLWSRSRCDCERPYIGEDCSLQVKPATFSYGNTTSYAYFKIPEMPAYEFNVSMFIRTRESLGILVHAGDFGGNFTDDQLSFTRVQLQIYQGKLEVGFNDNVFYPHPPKLNDGEYHFIDVKINRSNLLVTLDNNSFAPKIIFKPINLTSNDFYVGGLPSQGQRKRRATSSGRYFKGVIQDVRLNGDKLLLFPFNDTEGIFEEAVPVEPEGMQNVLEGVISDPVCPLTNQSYVSNPCHNGGNCEVTFNDYVCNCTEEWTGKNCDVPIFCKQLTCPIGLTCYDLPNGAFECVGPATFAATNSPVSYVWNGRNANLSSLSFEIKTRSINATVLLLESETTLVRLELDWLGRMLLSFEYTEYNDTILDLQSISDGQWHYVTVATMPNSSTSLQIDYRVAIGNMTHASSMTSPFLYSTNNPVKIGKAFKGCLNNVRIGGRLIPFYRPSDLSNHSIILNSTGFVMTSLSSVPTPGCHGDDVCGGTSPCLNNGTCQDLFNNFTCNCTTGFTGANCSINIDNCANITCSGRGSCLDKVDNFVCDCSPGFQGKFCEMDINECRSTPCLNNGTCHNKENFFRCDCDKTSYTGERCEIDVTQACGNDVNPDAPCQNGGSCKNMTTNSTISYECQCLSPYMGITCEKEINFCENITCMNDGRCEANETFWSCTCLPGYGGKTCQHVIEQCKNDTCHNNGTCYDTSDGFKCTCAEGYLGLRCNFSNLCLDDGNDTLCANNGNCTVTVDDNFEPSFSCICPPTHTGKKCFYFNPCYNTTCGNGECQLRWNAVTSEEISSSGEEPLEVMIPTSICACEGGYTGAQCSQQVSSFGSSIIFLTSAVGGVMFFLIITAVVYYFVTITLDRRATSGTYSPSKQETARHPPVSGDFSGIEMWSQMKPPPKLERLI